MKKKIITLGLLVGVLSLNSCVKDNESDAVQAQRQAQVEKTKAEAAKAMAEAKKQEVENAYEQSIAELKKKNVEYQLTAQEYSVKQQALLLKEKELDAALRDNDQVQADKLQAALIKAKSELQNAKANAAAADKAFKENDATLQKTIKKLEITLAADLARIEKEESLKSKSEYLKVLVKELGEASSKYNNYKVEIATKNKKLVTKQKELSGLESGLVDVKEYAKAQIAQKETEVAYKEAEVEAYENILKAANFGGKTLGEVQSLYGQAKAKLEELEKEAGSLDRMVYSKIRAVDEVKKVLTTQKGQAELEFFKGLNKLKNVDATYVKNYNGVFELESNNEGSVGKYNILPNKVSYSNSGLVARFVNSVVLDNAIDKLEVDAQPLKKDIEDKEKDEKKAQDKYDQAKKEWEQDKNNAGKQSAFKKASDDLKAARKATAKAKDDYKKNTQDLKDIKDAKSIIYEQANIDALVAKIKEFSDAQAVAITEINKYDAKVEEVYALRKELNVYEGYINGNYTTFGASEINSKIEALKSDILTLKEEIAGNTTVSDKEQAIAQAKAKIAKLELIIKELEAKEKAAKIAYDAALEAIENYKG